jgi:hypothetical protein
LPFGRDFGVHDNKDRRFILSEKIKQEKSIIDISLFIKKMNAVKTHNLVFREEAPTHILPQENRNLLLLWKGSATTQQEALLILSLVTYRDTVEMH